MSNDELKVRVEIMRALGVQKLRDGDLEIVMFSSDPEPISDNDRAARLRDRYQFGGK